MAQDKNYDIMSSCGLLPKQTIFEEKNNIVVLLLSAVQTPTPGVGRS